MDFFEIYAHVISVLSYRESQERREMEPIPVLLCHLLTGAQTRGGKARWSLPSSDNGIWVSAATAATLGRDRQPLSWCPGTEADVVSSGSRDNSINGGAVLGNGTGAVQAVAFGKNSALPRTDARGLVSGLWEGFGGSFQSLLPGADFLGCRLGSACWAAGV